LEKWIDNESKEEKEKCTCMWVKREGKVEKPKKFCRKQLEELESRNCE
jgi:hypothetical protein